MCVLYGIHLDCGPVSARFTPHRLGGMDWDDVVVSGRFSCCSVSLSLSIRLHWNCFPRWAWIVVFRIHGNGTMHDIQCSNVTMMYHFCSLAQWHAQPWRLFSFVVSFACNWVQAGDSGLSYMGKIKTQAYTHWKPAFLHIKLLVNKSLAFGNNYYVAHKSHMWFYVPASQRQHTMRLLHWEQEHVCVCVCVSEQFRLDDRCLSNERLLRSEWQRLNAFAKLCWVFVRWKFSKTRPLSITCVDAFKLCSVRANVPSLKCRTAINSKASVQRKNTPAQTLSPSWAV